MSEPKRIKVTIEIPRHLCAALNKTSEDDVIRILARAMRLYAPGYGDAEEAALSEALDLMDDRICETAQARK